MKAKKYEQIGLIYLGITFLIIFELLGIILLYKEKEFDYLILSGIVIKNKYVILTVTKEEKKLIRDNRILFFNDQKKKYEIIKDYGKVLNNEKKDYYQLMIRYPFSNKYKANDTLKLVFPKKKYRKIEIFKIIWGGD